MFSEKGWLETQKKTLLLLTILKALQIHKFYLLEADPMYVYYLILIYLYVRRKEKVLSYEKVHFLGGESSQVYFQ